MRVELVDSGKRRYMPLLLVGDEQESMVCRYLDRGELYAMFDDDGGLVAVAVVTDEGGGVCELKNIAVEPRCHRRGYGRRMVEYLCRRYRRMVEYLCRRYAARFHTMLVGTGETPATTAFYTSCGFIYSHTVPDFFTTHYDHPVIDGGILLRHMLYYRRPLSPR